MELISLARSVDRETHVAFLHRAAQIALRPRSVSSLARSAAGGHCLWYVTEARSGRSWCWPLEGVPVASSGTQRSAEGIALLDDEAHWRAVDDVKGPVFWRGALVGRVTEYSD